jgi:aspartate/methionine/tyrosine aminotransferase
VPLIDLTASNPTQAGFAYPPALLDALADPAGLIYDPHPLGLRAARRAVADALSTAPLTVDENAVVLTASTSEGYSLIFKLLATAGDEVLVPRPSYPLFEHLTRLEAIVPVPYRLEYDGQWRIDLESVASAISSRSRAILVVNPNNPTGSFVQPAERRALFDLAVRHRLAIIADEVFLDYGLADDGQASVDRRMGPTGDALVFSLGGLSKLAGLPQIKLAWIAVSGPLALVSDAMTRLEIICDTYLSVSIPVQIAAPRLLTESQPVRRQILDRVRSNFRELRRLAVQSPACSVLRADGGWYGVVQVPAVAPEEEMVLAILERDGVVVHPGYFFDFPAEAYLVVSLLPDADAFREGVTRVLRRVS